MTQASSKNPYRPGVGIRPLYLAGRDPSLRRFSAMLRAAPEQQASMRVTGLRGVGKTVLLGAFGERAEEANWEPAELELQPSHNTDEALQDALGGLLQRAQARLSRFERLRAAAGRAIRAGSLSVTWEDVSLSIAPGSEREGDLAREIFDTVELTVAKGAAGGRPVRPADACRKPAEGTVIQRAPLPGRGGRLPSERRGAGSVYAAP